MSNEKYLQNILENGLHYGPIVKQFFLEEFNSIDFSSTIKKKISENVKNKNDFEITVLEMQNILPALNEKIENLINHPDFNPFKQELRQRFPEQYSSQPFKFKQITYYLHTKTFTIDNLIMRVNSFKELIEEHIKVNQSIRYVYVD